MSQFRNILLLLLGLKLSLGATAQTIVTGSNLNIGTNNTLNSNRGNAIGTDHWLGSYHSLATGLTNEGAVRIGRKDGLIDNYGFEMHPKRPFRNIITVIGSWVAGEGTPYDIYGYGNGQLKHKIIIPMKY